MTVSKKTKRFLFLDDCLVLPFSFINSVWQTTGNVSVLSGFDHGNILSQLQCLLCLIVMLLVRNAAESNLNTVKPADCEAVIHGQVS